MTNSAGDEEARVLVIEEDVSAQAAVCAEDLRKAEPALLAAQEALNTLNKTNLTELKSFGTPPDAVVNVTGAVLVLFSEKGKVPKDRSWKACKMMMGKVDQFLNDLIYYDKENIHPDVQKAIQPYLNDSEFSPEKIMSKSSAAAGLCAWVINIMRFFDVYAVVEPKRRALNKANTELADARNKLAELKERLSVRFIYCLETSQYYKQNITKYVLLIGITEKIKSLESRLRRSHRSKVKMSSRSR